jgi:hypothetical protein
MIRACSAWLNALVISASAIGAMAALANPSRARYQEHSTRLCERCEEGCAYHAEGAEHEHAAPAIHVPRNAAGKHKSAEH